MSGRAKSSDYFQLLSYCTVLRPNHGVLIYAQVEGGEPEHDIRVVHSGQRLTTYRLELSGGQAGIEESIKDLADQIVAWSR